MDAWHKNQDETEKLMQKVVAAFVGYAPHFELPFQVSTNHSTALQFLSNDKEFYEFNGDDIPRHYGFVIKDDDGQYRYADRRESFHIAKEANQLNGRSGLPESLDSYQISKYETQEIFDLNCIADDVNKSFAGKTFTTNNPNN